MVKILLTLINACLSWLGDSHFKKKVIAQNFIKSFNIGNLEKYWNVGKIIKYNHFKNDQRQQRT